MLPRPLNFPCPEHKRKYNVWGNITAASNGNKYIVDGSVEIGKVKEMLTSGNMLSSVIPGPRSPACDLGVPFRDVGGKQAQVLPVTPWCLSCPPTACTFAGFLCICFRKLGQGGCWTCRANTVATMLPNTHPPHLPFPFSPSPPLEQISHRFTQKPQQKLLVLRAAWTCQWRLQRLRRAMETRAAPAAVPTRLLCRSRPTWKGEYWPKFTSPTQIYHSGLCQHPHLCLHKLYLWLCDSELQQDTFCQAVVIVR